MFYPQEMSEIELVLPEHLILQVMEALGNTGNFHQVDASYLTTEYGASDTTVQDWRVKASTFASMERRLSNLMRTLKIEDGDPPDTKLPAIANEQLIFSVTDEIENEVKDLIEDLDAKQRRVEQLRSFIRLLEPLEEVDIELESLQNLDYIFLILGVGPVRGLERLKTSLARIPFELLILDQEEKQAVILLAGPRQNADVLERAARSAFINPLEIPAGYRGTPREMIRTMSDDLKRLEQQIAGQQDIMDDLRRERTQQLQTMLWRVRKSRMISNAIAHFGKLRYTYLVVGWIPSDQIETLQHNLKEISGDILIETIPCERNNASQKTPSSLKNKGIFHAFQSLVTIYGQPKYGEIDPTILLGITFPILFGAMFGDVGQGLVLAILGGLLASKRVKALRGASDLGAVVAACGLSATLFGFLYGSVFGIEHLLHSLWIRPMENIMQILIITIIGGIVLLSAAFLLSIFNAARSKDWAHLIFSNHGLAGFLLFIAMIGLGAGFLAPEQAPPAGIFLILAVLSSLMIMVVEPVERYLRKRKPLIQGGMGMFLIQAFFEVFETVISIFSNTLSYVRVGAFAVAHAGLSAVIFILAEMVSPTQGIGYWVVVVLGNLFIIGFEGMIVGIQTLRLEYYEFFSKFFSGGGTPFRPITLDKP
ncbi:MAG: hypothetical protein JW750_01115 [Anaerolineaceae bacterium]|nr:hypothetical protein [Anaerolineaceae bacterium]